METQDTLGAGLVVVGIVLLNSNKFIGMLFIGFGLGYNLRPHMKKMFKKKKSQKDSITIPRKVMYGIAPAIAIIAVLLSKDKAPEVLLFLIGIVVGIFIGKGFFEKI